MGKPFAVLVPLSRRTHLLLILREPVAVTLGYLVGLDLAVLAGLRAGWVTVLRASGLAAWYLLVLDVVVGAMAAGGLARLPCPPAGS